MKIKSFISNLLFIVFTIFFSTEIFSQKKIDEKKLSLTKTYTDKNLKAHLNYCIELINNALITKTNN
ncbi:MAG: hypothetical protein CND00_03550 [Cryomorphaceae bacterium MED-G14]|nr:MAG: hypothetical protein CND00_03550 [Cryomorphaceae bacterium MED-G14]|tara:strand:- start:3983 stop:4183 length:201 start_codon:yes stop_codon:yes gene_type:complete